MEDNAYEQESVEDTGSSGDDPDDIDGSYSLANEPLNSGYSVGGEVLIFYSRHADIVPYHKCLQKNCPNGIP